MNTTHGTKKDQVIPHEQAVQRFAEATKKAAINDFCHAIAKEASERCSTIVGGPSVPVPRRPVRRPPGSFDVWGFARTFVLQALNRCFNEVSTQKSSRKLCKKWDPTYQQMALDMAFERGSEG